MTQQQRLLNLFMEKHYKELSHKFRMKDMLHTAYLKTFLFPKDITPLTYDNILHVLSEMYYRSIQQELQYSMRYFLPDPLFWIYHNQQTAAEEEQQQQEDNNKSTTMTQYVLSKKETKKITEYVRRHCSQQDFEVFRLVFLRHLPCRQIAKLLNISIKNVEKTILTLNSTLDGYITNL